MKTTFRSLAVIALLATVFTSCQKSDELATPMNDGANGARQSNPNRGYVYLESNDAAQNSILVYEQLPNGNLSYDATVASGGAGAGAGLGSQGAVTLNADHTLLFAVNAGSNTVSAFTVDEEGDLTLASTMSTDGTMPISVDVYDNVVYVVNAGSGTIHGFTVTSSGMLSSIAGSTQSLSSATAGPAEIRFQPSGAALYVTEKATNMITSFTLNANNVASAAMSVASSGMTPFGFSFYNNYMTVTNAAGGAAGASSVSAYATDGSGGVSLTGGPLANNQGAACWLAFDASGNAYVANTGSGNISTYHVSSNGTLQLLNAVAGITGGHPADIVVSSNNKYVYNINGTENSITIHKTNSNGMLNYKSTVNGLPDFAAGLAAY